MEATIQNEKLDSIKVSKTSAGKYSWEIKLYFDKDKEKTTPTLIIEELKKANEQMKAWLETGDT